MLTSFNGSRVLMVLIMISHQPDAQAESTSPHTALTLEPTHQAVRQRARAVMKLIEAAIARGVPQYNQGDPAACRDIYSVTMRAIALLEPSLSSLSSNRNAEATLSAAREMSPDQG